MEDLRGENNYLGGFLRVKYGNYDHQILTGENHNNNNRRSESIWLDNLSKVENKTDIPVFDFAGKTSFKLGEGSIIPFWSVKCVENLL